MLYYILDESNRLFAGPFVIWAYAQMIAVQNGFRVVNESEMDVLFKKAPHEMA